MNWYWLCLPLLMSGFGMIWAYLSRIDAALLEVQYQLARLNAILERWRQP